MSLSDLYLDYGVSVAPPGDKHYRENWINVECPFCEGHEGHHLGFNITAGYFSCWRSGGHPVILTLSKLLRIPYSKAKELSRTYRVQKGGGRALDTTKLVKIGRNAFKLPSGVGKLQEPHCKYLINRNFDPQQLQVEWNVQGTGPGSVLKDPEDGSIISYANRILIPIYWEEQMVSFQTRGYSKKYDKKNTKKYLACPMSTERVHHKHLMYGHSNRRSDIGIIVEGVFDVWRLGMNAYSTLGVQYTQKQLNIIRNLFERVYIIFDNEKQAQQQATKLRDSLLLRGVDSYVYNELETDPADLAPDDVPHLLNQLKKLT